MGATVERWARVKARGNSATPIAVYPFGHPSMLLPIHVVAGGLAMVLGAVALLARKGATVHRTSGLLFVTAMVTMGLSGSALALQKSLTDANVTGGFLSAYFVVTALTTVRPVARWTRWVNGIALVAAVAWRCCASAAASRRMPARAAGSTASRSLCSSSSARC
jgi:uncharacterized membrane protein